MPKADRIPTSAQFRQRRKSCVLLKLNCSHRLLPSIFRSRSPQPFSGSIATAQTGKAQVSMQLWIAAGLGLLNIANGLAMLIASSIWWAVVPGVQDTGPFNRHFVQDVGAAFVVAGVALAARAWRTEYWPASLAGAGFLGIHSALHLAEIVAGHNHQAAADLATIILPAALAVYAALPNKGDRRCA
ncbi:hypothetical protein [Bradyrhizobium sp. ORS 111]|uniref:hypothetical protein n=1 Tax=Bradyrhizobium sp. ORS 111 TaxID=1685958 RepID=UPI00388EB9F7